MSWKKRILKHERTIAAISWLLAMYIRFVYLTSRKKYVIDPAAQPYMSGKENGVFAFWHGRMILMLPFRPPGRVMHVLSTTHSDGQIAAATVRQFGNYTIYGSSTRGGLNALRDMLKALKRGDNISITPDGPRGPIHVATLGIVTVAKSARKPVLTVAFSSSRYKPFNSWDRFMLALPFGRVVFCVDAPIFIERDADDEAMRMMIEQSLNAMTQKADEITHA